MLESSVLPSPSCPSSSLPQQYAVPLSTAQAWFDPRAIEVLPCDAARAGCDAGTSKPRPAVSENSTARMTREAGRGLPYGIFLADMPLSLSSASGPTQVYATESNL